MSHGRTKGALSSHSIVILVALALLAMGSAHSTRATANPLLAHPASAQLSLNPTPNSSAPAPANYDEQLGITFTQSFTTIAYNVTAVAQSDSNGYGPAYLLNGLSNTGYWYQVGLSYNWPYLNGGYDSGFDMNYEVFDSSGKSIFPADGNGGLLSLSGTVNQGDEVLLRLHFSNGQVIMLIQDKNTSAEAQESYTAAGTKFVGLSSTSDSNGFFTGLMTEWYHVDAYYGGEGKVTYSDPSFALSSAYMWADEYNAANPSPAQFSEYQYVSFVDPHQIQTFATNGATVYADAYTFITGALDKGLLTLSYSVSGGGEGYSSPSLRYTYYGVQQDAILTAIPTTYLVDLGTSWSVSTALPGGSSTERWQTNQQTSGSVSSSQMTDLVYYHQFEVAFAFTVVGRGSGYSAPTIQSSQFGSTTTVPANQSVWIDAGSSYSFADPLAGSTSLERWKSLSTTGTVTEAGVFTISFYHQFEFAVDYSLVGGGTPTAPTMSGVQFGQAYGALVGNLSTFLDSGSNWSLPSLLTGSTSHERWETAQSANGTVSKALTFRIDYHHQYYVTMEAAQMSGGSVNPSSGWYDTGITLPISGVTGPGWKFEGWSGLGNGSYSGPFNSTSIQVGGAIVENASFYPGLKIFVGNDGTVSYSFGSESGTVSGGVSQTVFVRPGTTITLNASPSSIVYDFVGWTAAANGTSGKILLTLGSPEVVQANFSFNFVVVGGIGGALIAVAASLILVMRRGTHSKSPASP